MLVVTKFEQNTLYYNCECGAHGKCILRPLSEGNIVTILSCAMCGDSVKVSLDKSLDKLTWAIVTENIVVDE